MRGSIAREVERIIDSFPCIKKALEHDVISITRLAKKIQREVEHSYGKQVSLSSIVMALERMKGNKEIKKYEYSIENISTTSSIILLIYPKNKIMDKNMEKLYEKILLKEGKLNIVEGNYEITLISENSLKRKITSIMGEPIKEINDLVMITLSFSEKMLETPGFISYVLKELSFENINIVEILSSHRELSLIIREEEFIDAYKCIQRIF